MKTIWLVVLAGCGGAAHQAPVDNTGGEAKAHAPCYPDKTEVTARELYEAAGAGKPGTCSIVETTESKGGEGDWEAREIVDGDEVVGTFDGCGVEVRVAGIVNDEGIGVGNPFAAVEDAYPEPKFTYDVAGGLGGEAQVSVHMDGLDVAWITLDGMEGDDLEGQHVASYRTSFACD